MMTRAQNETCDVIAAANQQHNKHTGNNNNNNSPVTPVGNGSCSADHQVSPIPPPPPPPPPVPLLYPLATPPSRSSSSNPPFASSTALPSSSPSGPVVAPSTAAWLAASGGGGGRLATQHHHPHPLLLTSQAASVSTPLLHDELFLERLMMRAAAAGSGRGASAATAAAAAAAAAIAASLRTGAADEGGPTSKRRRTLPPAFDTAAILRLLDETTRAAAVASGGGPEVNTVAAAAAALQQLHEEEDVADDGCSSRTAAERRGSSTTSGDTTTTTTTGLIDAAASPRKDVMSTDGKLRQEDDQDGGRSRDLNNDVSPLNLCCNQSPWRLQREADVAVKAAVEATGVGRHEANRVRSLSAFVETASRRCLSVHRLDTRTPASASTAASTAGRSLTPSALRSSRDRTCHSADDVIINANKKRNHDAMITGQEWRDQSQTIPGNSSPTHVRTARWNAGDYTTNVAAAAADFQFNDDVISGLNSSSSVQSSARPWKNLRGTHSNHVTDYRRRLRLGRSMNAKRQQQQQPPPQQHQPEMTSLSHYGGGHPAQHQHQLPPVPKGGGFVEEAMCMNGAHLVDGMLRSSAALNVCHHCDIIYADRMLFMLHMGLHNVNNPWQCNMCGTVCADRQQFALHVLHY